MEETTFCTLTYANQLHVSFPGDYEVMVVAVATIGGGGGNGGSRWWWLNQQAFVKGLNILLLDFLLLWKLVS